MYEGAIADPTGIGLPAPAPLYVLDVESSVVVLLLDTVESTLEVFKLPSCWLSAVADHATNNNASNNLT